ncbi:MAG: alpha/beta hydrolase [Planctomycetota bacterium]|nr:alpha/beta hydrolase [Planctomycetota bacterium]
MNHKTYGWLLMVVLAFGIDLPASPLQADKPIRIWPGLAPGENTGLKGTIQPYRKNEKPPVTRVEKITLPTMTYHPAKHPNGSAVVILPGGGFRKVVPDKEGSEFAAILNQAGLSVFVLSYRTQSAQDAQGWRKPLQDAQRAMAYVRFHSQRWGVEKKRIGLVGFSAGGNVAVRLLCGPAGKSYALQDPVDDIGHRPDFAMLIYPWNIQDAKSGKLVDGMKVPRSCPPTFMVHTHDDRSTSLGSVAFYVGLKQNRIPAALHVYANGGHGYGTRAVSGSQVGNWPAEAVRWIETLK